MLLKTFSLFCKTWKKFGTTDLFSVDQSAHICVITKWCMLVHDLSHTQFSQWWNLIIIIKAKIKRRKMSETENKYFCSRLKLHEFIEHFWSCHVMSARFICYLVVIQTNKMKRLKKSIFWQDFDSFLICNVCLSHCFLDWFCLHLVTINSSLQSVTIIHSWLQVYLS